MRRRQWHPTPVLLPGKFHGRKSLVGYSPWGREELDTTERPHFHCLFSCIREGNGNPLQCSCLENPRDGRAWWAVVYGVAQSRTQLKRVSSSSSSSVYLWLYLTYFTSPKNSLQNSLFMHIFWGKVLWHSSDVYENFFSKSSRETYPKTNLMIIFIVLEQV